MKKTAKILASAAVVAAMSAGVLGSFVAPANAATPSPAPEIIGGQKASNPWAFQLATVDRTTGNGQLCTAEALSDSWVLTAKHCVLKNPNDTTSVAAAADIFIVKTNNTADIQDPAKRVFADQVKVWSGGDLALVHVNVSNGLSSYPTIGASYTPKASDAGVIQGYGLRKEGGIPSCPIDPVRADWLYKANVTVQKASTDAYGGTAILVKGVNGIANHGDSGGPLTLASSPNQIIGVTSNGPGNCSSSTTSTVNYTNVTLTAPRAWIKSTSGL